MSTEDGSDDKEPVEHDGFEEELARLLSELAVRPRGGR